MFIVLDGPDGSGKTTLSKLLAEYLKAQSVPAMYTFEPTMDSMAGCELRSMLRSGDIQDIYAFANLFVEDREIHLNRLILPALERNEVVICDRYKYSNLVYQQIQGVEAEHIIQANLKFLVPDYTFIILSESPDILLKRISGRGLEKDIFEEQKFISRTLECYRKMSDYFPHENIIYLKAEETIEKSLKLILQKCGLCKFI